MDTESISAFQNPSKTFDPVEAAASTAEDAKVVNDANVPAEFGGVPASPSRLAPDLALNSYQFGPSHAEMKLAQEKEEKARIIGRLNRLNARKDFPSIQFSESDNLATLRKLNKVATHAGRAKMTVDFFKRATIFIARVAEGLCERFPNKYVDLTGYAEHLMLTISQYDNLLADIYDFYADSIAEMSPVLTYLGAIGSNMVVYSISRRLMGGQQQRQRQREAEEKRKREQEIQKMLAQQEQYNRMREEAMRHQNRPSGGMTGPTVSARSDARDARAVEDDDTKSVGFESVRTNPEPSSEQKKSVSFAEETESGRKKIDLS